MQYETVHEDLVAALPELRRPYERLFADWDDFDGEPPGQYNVFPDTLGKLLEIVLSLPEGTPGREDVLRRALDFGEAMLAAPADGVAGVAIDSVAEILDLQPAGREVAERLGGPELREWFSVHSTDDRERTRNEDIIDLWGVRGDLAPLLPDTPLNAIPGISHPADYLTLGSLDEARAAEDGTVLLSTFGTSHLYVVIRAADVAIDEAELGRAAQGLAAYVGGEDPLGAPGLRLRRIPRGERVWNMDIGVKRHTRLREEPWTARALGRVAQQVLDYLTGRTTALTLAPPLRARATARWYKARHG